MTTKESWADKELQYGFDLVNLKLFIYGDFEDVDDIDPDGEIEKFMIPILTEEYPDAMLEWTGGDANKEADWTAHALEHSFISDCLVDLGPVEYERLFARASAKYNE